VRKYVLAATAITSAVCVGVAAAASGVPGGGVGNTVGDLCKKGGWKVLVRADQTPFADQGECVSYAAAGGIPALPTGSAARTACAAIGGTFSTDPNSSVTGSWIGAPVLWTCNDWPYLLTPAPAPSTWLGYCQSDGGDSVSITSNGAVTRGITCHDVQP
jgi:hypothetical protein